MKRDKLMIHTTPGMIVKGTLSERRQTREG
jgi:hypothetical protein